MFNYKTGNIIVNDLGLNKDMVGFLNDYYDQNAYQYVHNPLSDKKKELEQKLSQLKKT